MFNTTNIIFVTLKLTNINVYQVGKWLYIPINIYENMKNEKYHNRKNRRKTKTIDIP